VTHTGYPAESGNGDSWVHRESEEARGNRSARRALQRLKQQLLYPERQATESFFGSATQSAKWATTANTPPPKVPKRKGTRAWHLGVRRHRFDASHVAQVVDIAPFVGAHCPDCDTLLEDKGTDSRAVLESRPMQAERVLDRLPNLMSVRHTLKKRQIDVVSYLDRVLGRLPQDIH